MGDAAGENDEARKRGRGEGNDAGGGGVLVVDGRLAIGLLHRARHPIVEGTLDGEGGTGELGRDVAGRRLDESPERCSRRRDDDAGGFHLRMAPG